MVDSSFKSYKHIWQRFCKDITNKWIEREALIENGDGQKDPSVIVVRIAVTMHPRVILAEQVSWLLKQEKGKKYVSW